MADEPRNIPVAVDDDISRIAAEIDALRKLASDPEKAEDSARIYDFSIRWGVLLSGRLKRLEHYYRAAQLTEGQESRYRELRLEFKEAMTLIERLGLGRPRVPLED